MARCGQYGCRDSAPSESYGSHASFAVGKKLALDLPETYFDDRPSFMSWRPVCTLDKRVDPLSLAGAYDVFKFTMHRASDVDRHFIAMFFGTDYEVNIEDRRPDIVSLAVPDTDAAHYSQSTPVCEVKTRQNITAEHVLIQVGGFAKTFRDVRVVY
ncbi:hypothetical protein M405DRAFT_923529 [Rhizopogon salebrosus TDB-379]|nr:hypothetical protein M405DRAFT_923529 [Rhizopogon salebrosus TDB-379]